MYEISHYLTIEGQDLYQTWLNTLHDRQAKVRVMVRVERLRGGNFGDCKPLREGVWELRIDHGPGYRVYYAIVDRRAVLLLSGGDKRRQDADIKRAIDYWHDFQRRNR